MAVLRVGGDKLVHNKTQLTAGANLADKSIVVVAGTIGTNGAVAYGVVEKDTASGDIATIKNGGGSILEVFAMGAVTAGSMVEVLAGTMYADISGTSTSINAAGVQNLASGYPVGLAHTSSDAGGTVLVEWFGNQAKSA